MPPLSSPDITDRNQLRRSKFFARNSSFESEASATDTSGRENWDEEQEEVSEFDEPLPPIRRRRRDASRLNNITQTDDRQITFEESAKEAKDNESGTVEPEAPLQAIRPLESVRPGEFIVPQSTYSGFIPPVPKADEITVLEDFMREIQHQTPDGKDFIEFDLNNFSIYLPKTVQRYSHEMVGLQNLGKNANSQYCFDGILSCGSQQRWLQEIPFKTSSIGNYGSDMDAVEDEIWIQSDLIHGSDRYYRLKKPSDEYARFHEGFVWLANLAKHFVDYLDAAADNESKVSIHNFRVDFYEWLERNHADSPKYQAWYEKYNRRDFRCHVAANIDFLWKETHGVNEALLSHPVWKELMLMDFVPRQKIKETKTVVTQYVYECFEHLKFGNQLVQIAESTGVQYRRRSLGQTLQLTTNTMLAGSFAAQKPLPAKKSILVGDVLSVPMDDKSISGWKDELSKWKTKDTCWYVLVQGINIEKNGSRSFDIIWLYKASDTTCAKMKYPHSRELFLSENCNCKGQKILEDEVLSKFSVAWNGAPSDLKSDFFVRQTYLGNNAFVTLKECHKHCQHYRGVSKPRLEALMERYKIGDTILYSPPANLKSPYDLEPGEIVRFTEDPYLNIRRLLRQRDSGSTADIKPNELVYSDKIISIRAQSIERKCYIRFYSRSEVEQGAIPAPYNRDGTGDTFYITTRLIGNELKPIQSHFPKSLIQGPDFKSTPAEQRLRGLDLYCGGGNFGRGLEEGGAIRNTHAVDIDVNAIHTYWANLEDTRNTKLFNGSVNDMLAEALKGNPSKSDLIPLPGDIDFISAGSPCPGFSALNSHRDNAQGLKNQSLVASVAAYIDVYRPKYALLENVVTMAQKGKNRDEDVLSQLICCVVGMGYQVQVFNLDAWSFGSPQSRSRLFVSIAAPGLEPPPHPSLSHSHPDGTRERGLGKMASGHSFGERLFGKTPFKFVTAQEATADLPDIGDGRTFLCTYHPDHRMARGISRQLKSQIEAIPINPRGMNFVRTNLRGLLTPAERLLFPQNKTKLGRPRHNVGDTSHAWERVHPQKLFPTIATSASPECSRTGRTIHWDQHRLITVLEVRRAQGFPDDEVLTGGRSKQWRIVGNSVARTVALALGLSITEACLKNCLKEHSNATGVVAQKDYVSDIDSVLNSFSFESAEEYFDEESPNSEIRSQISYKHLLDKSGLKSSTSGNDSASTRSSTDSSDQIATKVVQKRKHSLSVRPQPKRKRLLGPTSKRDPKTLWNPANEPLGPSVPKLSISTLKSPLVKQQNLFNTAVPEIQPSKMERHTSLPNSLLIKQAQSLHKRFASSSKRTINGSVEMVDLTADDEEDEEEVVVVSTAKKIQPYVPVDNSMFAAYAQTNKTMGHEQKRKR